MQQNRNPQNPWGNQGQNNQNGRQDQNRGQQNNRNVQDQRANIVDANQVQLDIANDQQANANNLNANNNNGIIVPGPVVAGARVAWNGTSGNLATVTALTKGLKAVNFDAASVVTAYAGGIVAEKQLPTNVSFQEVVDNAGADYHTQMQTVINFAKGEFYVAATCVSPHASDKTLAQPSTWAKWQKLIFVDGRGVLTDVHWLDILADLKNTQGALIPYRTANWYISILSAGVRGHFLKGAVISNQGYITETGQSLVSDWIKTIENDAAQKMSSKKVKLVFAYITANPTIAAADLATIKNKIVKAKFVT